MRLIDGEKLANELEGIATDKEAKNVLVIKALNIIVKMIREDYPTIDAVPVVRCNNCKHCFKDKFSHLYCEITNECRNYPEVYNDFYCANGRSRNEQAD